MEPRASRQLPPCCVRSARGVVGRYPCRCCSPVAVYPPLRSCIQPPSLAAPVRCMPSRTKVASRKRASPANRATCCYRCCHLVVVAAASSSAIASPASREATWRSSPPSAERRRSSNCAANAGGSSACLPSSGAWTRAPLHHRSRSPSPCQGWWRSVRPAASRCRCVCARGRCRAAVGPCRRRCLGSRRSRAGPEQITTLIHALKSKVKLCSVVFTIEELRRKTSYAPKQKFGFRWFLQAM